jgi:ABC-2 type transport system permease protein
MGVKNVISHILIIAWKDLMELFRNKLALAMLVLMPIFMMVMAGFIFPSSTSMSNVSIALVNEDEGYGNSSMSSMFINFLEEINNSTEMMVLTNASSFDEVRNMIQRGDVEGGIVITRNFSLNLMTGEQGSIIIVTDQSNPQLSIALQTGLNAVFDQMGTVLAQEKVEPFLSLMGNATNSLAVVKPYHVETQGAIPGTFNYFDFMAPGLMAMTVMMSVMTGLPAAISHEREIGTLDGMMVAPIRRLGIILGKTLAQTVRGLLQGTLILILAVVLFGVVIHGNILLIFALLFLGVFSFVGLGVVITSFAKDQETAMMVMMTLMFPMMFLSGVFFPIQQMPWYMQSISKALPLTYAITALRKVMVLGADLSAISLEVAVLIGFGTVMTLIALPVFRKVMTK